MCFIGFLLYRQRRQSVGVIEIELALGLFTFATSAQAEFQFKFALIQTDGKNVYLQGAESSKPAFVSACNSQGTNCACEFLSSDGTVISKTSSSEISYESRGNYFRCVFSGNLDMLKKARLVKNNSSQKSASLEIQTAASLTLPQLLGRDLDFNKVRSIFRYSCEFNFLQKEGTTTQSFDCSNAQVSCDPDGNLHNNFCLLQARFPYFLYSDNLSNNFWNKPSDRLYNGGETCGQQIKRFNCADAEGTPVKQFGLFGERVGMWEFSVQLPSGPDQIPVSYGFAAKTGSLGECPPGLEKRVFYRIAGGQGVVTSDIQPSHNFTSNLDATEVSAPDQKPASFDIQKFSQGHCEPGLFTACTMPGSFAGSPKAPQEYSCAGQTAICVIPATLLPLSLKR